MIKLIKKLSKKEKEDIILKHNLYDYLSEKLIIEYEEKIKKIEDNNNTNYLKNNGNFSRKMISLRSAASPSAKNAQDAAFICCRQNHILDGLCIAVGEFFCDEHWHDLFAKGDCICG